MSSRVILFSAAVLCLLQCTAGVAIQDLIGYPHSSATHQVFTPNSGNYWLQINKTAIPFIFDEIEYTAFEVSLFSHLYKVVPKEHITDPICIECVTMNHNFHAISMSLLICRLAGVL